ncbi:MAG TPA: cytochrome c [Xanthobacteraceae bacterium]|jgi:cytochrome c556|nr:cytochrome c [Xanthobacteraceae bacterium]
MFRTFLIVLCVLVCGATTAMAQSCQDVINKRQAFMKRSADMAKVGSSMVKGETPFDLAKAKEILATFAEDAVAMPTLFPDCSKTGDHTTAAPAIWDKPADFKAAQDKFSADVKAAQDNLKDLDSLKASFQSIGKDCGACHQAFRVKQG